MTTTLPEGAEPMSDDTTGPLPAALMAAIDAASDDQMAALVNVLSDRLGQCPTWCGIADHSDDQYDSHRMLVGKIVTDRLGVSLNQDFLRAGEFVAGEMTVTVDGVRTDLQLSVTEASALGELLTRAAGHAAQIARSPEDWR